MTEAVLLWTMCAVPVECGLGTRAAPEVRRRCCPTRASALRALSSTGSLGSKTCHPRPSVPHRALRVRGWGAAGAGLGRRALTTGRTQGEAAMLPDTRIGPLPHQWDKGPTLSLL